MGSAVHGHGAGLLQQEEFCRNLLGQQQPLPGVLTTHWPGLCIFRWHNSQHLGHHRTVRDVPCSQQGLVTGCDWAGL